MLLGHAPMTDHCPVTVASPLLRCAWAQDHWMEGPPPEWHRRATGPRPLLPTFVGCYHRSRINLVSNCSVRATQHSPRRRRYRHHSSLLRSSLHRIGVVPVAMTPTTPLLTSCSTVLFLCHVLSALRLRIGGPPKPQSSCKKNLMMMTLY